MNNFNILVFLDKKRNNLSLSEGEINEFISLVSRKKIPDYQISAFLMAVCIHGLSDQETTWLTLAMAKSGDFLLPIPNRKSGEIYIDKHSSGGIGDKTSLILLPIVAAGGLNVVKAAGRGLGFTGGTIDKLNSLSVNTDLSLDQAFSILDKAKIFIIAQTQNISPVDKTLYHLRDVTSTVESIPLIASSIMSKKLSLKLDYLFLDVKYGSGAFCKTLDYAKRLASVMYSIGKLSGLKVYVHITSMQQPLGYCVGNSLEVLESQEFLSGESMAPDLKEFIFKFAADIFVSTGLFSTEEEARVRVEEIIRKKEALLLCERWFELQGGDVESYKSKTYFSPKYSLAVKSLREGYLSFKNNEVVGWLANELGAGRTKVDSKIDFDAGMRFHKKMNDYVKAGDEIVTLYSSNPISSSIAERMLDNLDFSSDLWEENELIIEYREK